MKHLKPKILLIAHCYNNKAGVEEHLKVLAASLNDSYQVSIAFPEQERLWLFQNNQPMFSLPTEAIPLLAPYNAPICRESLNKILAQVRPDLIHIVHFVNWPLSILEQLLATKKPLIMSFHDYYLITPFWTMQGQDPRTTTTAEYAMKFFRSDISAYLQQRRALLLKILPMVNKLIVPSQYLRNQLQMIFPFEYEIIPYGIHPFEQKLATRDHSSLRFGYLGSLLPQKGWQFLLQAYQQIANQCTNSELHFYGGNADLSHNPERVRFHGVYEQSELPELLSNINIGIIPSVFAETYSIVLSEMWQAGIPAAVSDIGAMSDRVKDGINGKKFMPADVESLADVLMWFYTNDSWRSWVIPKPVLADQMAAEYNRIYQDALRV